MKNSSQILTLWLALGIAIALNIGLWAHSHKIYPIWNNIPIPPSDFTIKSAFLGDDIFAYRAGGIVLQNFGSVGAAQPLKDYNYDHLGEWFQVMDKLDPKSNFVPFLAAYFFSATQNPAQLPPVIAYLEEIGMRPGKWRWLAQAAYLARHRMENMDEALRLARKLGSIYDPKTMPNWTSNMEPMLRAEMGDKQAAYLLMLEILKANADRMNPSEVNSTVSLICEEILTPKEAAANPICKK